MKKVLYRTESFVSKFIAQIILAALVGYFAYACGASFFSYNNLISIVRQVSTMGIAALGVSFLMITGNIDFSVGAMYAFVGVFTALLYSLGVNLFIAIPLGLIVCTLLSCFSCWLSITFRISRLVVSMAMNMAVSGLGYIICDTKTIYGLPEGIKILGQGYIWIFPIPVVIFLALAVIVSFVLRRTYFGRYLFAVGGNETAARLSGINVTKMLYLSSAISGALAGFAGIICMSRTFCGSPSVGGSMSMDVISAAVLGGVSIMGGSGKTSGLVTGVLIMGILNVGLNMMGMQTNSQDVFRGIMMIVAVILDSRSKKISARQVAKE